jgi:hypothetical protein
MNNSFVILGLAAAGWALGCGGESRRRSDQPAVSRGGAAGEATTSGTTGTTSGTSGVAGGRGGTNGGGAPGAGGEARGSGGSTSGTGAAGDASTGGDPATGGVGDGGRSAGGEGGTGEEMCRQEECATGELWNPWTHACQAASLACPPPGQDNGGRCTTDAECRSNGSGVPDRPLCITQNGADFCSSYCVAPVDFGATDSFARGDCPEGSVCFRHSQFTAGEYVDRCVPECRDDSDCRTADGYYCRRTFEGRVYENGYCSPAHCVSRGCFGHACEC